MTHICPHQSLPCVQRRAPVGWTVRDKGEREEKFSFYLLSIIICLEWPPENVLDGNVSVKVTSMILCLWSLRI